ncbi:uncharacterized protein LOC125370532 [Ricinus communis]|uniref:uncharacterized protein LOC125370532 n=1 Tax=Ricinus communis TaxID=3988 RepID=UPI00201AD4B4|nr:uncharacterized protein LOC125370532 [Ricinus communis]
MGRKRLKNPEDIKDILLKALDDLVSVNSLFTVAVFLGLSFASPDQLKSLEVNRPECDPDEKMGKQLVVYEVVSFSSFLLSSLVAKSLKLFLSLFYSKTTKCGKCDGETQDIEEKKDPIFHAGRGFLYSLSILASIVGVVFLTISMAYVVEMKVGRFSCDIRETRTAVIALCVLVPLALVVYIPSVSAALFYCVIES